MFFQPEPFVCFYCTEKDLFTEKWTEAQRRDFL